MAVIEGFESVLSQIMLAKELYDIDRYDVVEQNFFDELSWDSYFENILGVISSIFSGYHGNYDDDEDIENMVFEDDIISKYFVYAWEQGKLQKLPYDKNPYLSQAQSEVERRLNVSNCVGWRLLGYTKTKKKARQSKILVQHYTSCGCNSIEHIAYGLIQLYAWFIEKNAEFETMKITAIPTAEPAVPVISIETEYREVKAA
jgi:hypothetical protein